MLSFERALLLSKKRIPPLRIIITRRTRTNARSAYPSCTTRPRKSARKSSERDSIKSWTRCANGFSPTMKGRRMIKKSPSAKRSGKRTRRERSSTKTHEEETDEFVCEKLNLCADDDATTVFDALRRTVRARARNVCLRRQIFASSWFHPSPPRLLLPPPLLQPRSACFANHGASEARGCDERPGFCRRREARFRRRVPSRFEDRFSDKEQRCAAAAEYESKSTTPCKRGWTTERHARICSAVKSCDFASVQCARERETDV